MKSTDSQANDFAEQIVVVPLRTGGSPAKPSQLPQARRSSRAWALGCGLFALGILGTALLAWAPEGLRGRGFLAMHGAMTAGMLLAWRGGDGSASQLRRVLLLGVAARLLLVPVPAYLTHDPERYLWDGFVATRGFDPYEHAPASPTLAALRSQWPPPRDNTRVPTLYPPGALALFSAASLAGPTGGFWAWKALAALSGLLVCLLGARWLRRVGRAGNLPLLALSPIAVVESSLGAHVDVFAALTVVIALALRARPPGVRGRAPSALHAAGMSLGLGALFKLLPVLLLVPLVWTRGWVRIAVGAGLALVVGYGGAFAAGLVPFGSTAIFVERWRFGSPSFALLEGIFGGNTALVIAAVLASGVLVLSLKVARRSLALGAQVALAAPLLFAPVVFPWYVLPLIALIAWRPSATAIAWCSALPLTYEVLDVFDVSGRWTPAAWPLWAIAGAMVLGGGIDLGLARRARKGLVKAAAA